MTLLRFSFNVLSLVLWWNFNWRNM